MVEGLLVFDVERSGRMIIRNLVITAFVVEIKAAGAPGGNEPLRTKDEQPNKWQPNKVNEAKK